MSSKTEYVVGSRKKQTSEMMAFLERNLFTENSDEHRKTCETKNPHKPQCMVAVSVSHLKQR